MIIRKLLIILLLFHTNLFSNEKIALYLDWLNQFQFAGYYIAKEKGYYKDFGLDVDIIEFNKTINITKKVMENNNYGIGKSSLVLDKINKNNIILLSTIFQISPMVFISLEKSNIKTPFDLKNKKIMITNDAKDTASLKSLISSQGLNTNDLIIQTHSFNIEDLISEKTDVMTAYLTNEPFVLEKKDIKYNIINPNDYNFNFYDGILFTSKNELINNPIRVQNFKEASLKGWEYAFKNIEETVKIIYDKYNSQNKSLEALLYEAKILKQLSKFDEGLIGDINPQKIEEIKRFYNLLGLNKNNNKFDTNSIIFDKTELILNNEKLDYLKNNHFTLLVEDNKIPYSFKLTNEFKGIEIDFWNLLSKKLNKPFNMEETINNKLSIFSNTIKTKFVYDFSKPTNDNYIYSNPIAQIPIAIATKNDKNFINDFSILSNKKIAVLKDLHIIDFLKSNYPNIEFIELDYIEDGFLKLKHEHIFGLIDNIYNLSLKINKEQLQNFKINTTTNYFINIYLEVEEKDFQFINLINSAINKLTKNEKKIILNNYQQILYQNSTNYSQIILYILPLLVLLLIFLFFNLKLKNEIKKRKKIEKKLINYATKDSLTNIYNRRKIEEIYEKELLRSSRYSSLFSIIFFDLNDFKPINDKLGHHIGDEVLVKVSQTISKNIREIDSFGRWGGDEFLMILPQTNITQAKIIVSSLENHLANMLFEFDNSFKISCSFGISEYEKGDTLDSLLRRADESMYQTKAEFKNKKS